MRILHVCESLPGGPASYLDEILPAQARRFGAHNIAVLAPAAQAGHLRCSQKTCNFVGYERTGRDLPSLLRLAAALWLQLRSGGADILHLHSSLAGAVGRLVALAGTFRGRVVYCAHGWAIDPNRDSAAAGLFRLVERALYGASDAIVNISPHEQEFLPAGWLRGGKLHLIPSGIAPDPSSPQARERDSDQPWRLVFIGRTDRQKGFDLLVDEMAALNGAARLTVIGAAVVEGPARPITSPNVEMAGWLPRDGIGGRMREADFVVMPSRWEGMPLVALEAMREGRPVIASARGPFPHIIEHRRTGLLVDIEQPGFLGRALAEVSPEEARKMGEAAREAFLRRFTSADMNERLIKLYQELQRAPSRRASLVPARAVLSPRRSG